MARPVRVPGFRLPVILLALLLGLQAGCTSPRRPENRLSAGAQAEALALFSQALLADAHQDYPAAWSHLQRALELDPDANLLYGPAAAVALKLEKPDDALRLARQFRSRSPGEPASWFLLAQVLALSGQPDQAGPVLKEAAARFPQDPEALLYLARYHIGRDDLPEALRIIESARETFASDPDILHLLGTLYVERARRVPEPQQKAAVEEGIAVLQQSLALEGTDPRRWQQLGYAWLAVNRPDSALTAFQEAGARAPGDLLIAQVMTELYIQAGRFEEALQMCEDAARRTGTDPEYWLRQIAEKMPPEKRPLLAGYLQDFIRGNPSAEEFYYAQLAALHLENSETDAAEACLQEGLALYPGRPRLRALLGYLRVRQQRFEEAYTELEAAGRDADSDRPGRSPVFVIHYAVAARESGRSEEAVRILSDACADDPSIPRYLMQAVLAGRPTLAIPSAIELLDALYSRRSDAPEPLYFISLLHGRQKNYPEALQYAARFETAASDGGHTNLLTGAFYYEYAALYERNGRLEEAETLFRKAIGLDPAVAASARNYIAYMWAERGERLDAGLELIRQALAEEPDNGAFIDTLGWIYYMQGRYPEALEHLQRALALEGNDPTVWEHLGDTWLKLDNLCAAVEHWKKALELSPDAAHLQQRILEHAPAAAP